jgi:deazaflavin-dependent oxidoreductase (nitroreductase family)
MGTASDGSPGPGTRDLDFRSLGWRAGNVLVSVLARVGVGPIQLLTTRGARSGQARTVPVVPVDHDGRTWLVAPYGPVAWVHNLRATGTARLRYGRTSREYRTREAAADEAGPVLKRYVAVATKARAQFEADHDAPVEEFVAEADRHPVFELVPAPSATP